MRERRKPRPGSILLLLVMIMVLQGVVPWLVPGGGNVFANVGDRITLDMGTIVTYGNGHESWVLKVVDTTADMGDAEDRYLYCVEPTKAWPGTGEFTISAEYDDEDTGKAADIRKMMYYSPGFKGYRESGGNAKALYDKYGMSPHYAVAHVLLSWRYGSEDPFVDTDWEDKGIRLFREIMTLPDPPDNFRTYIIRTGNGIQDLMGGYYVQEGDLSLKKVSTAPAATNGNSFYSLAGAEYGVYGSKSNAQDNKSKIASLTTKSDGSTDPVTLEKGTYYVKELKASPGFKRDSEIHSVTVKSGQEAVLTVEEVPEKTTLDLKKVSTKPGITDGNDNYSLAGAKYGVYLSQSDASADKDRQGTLTTTEDGSTNTVSVYMGTYYIKEVKASKGYELDTEIHKVTVSGPDTTTFSAKEVPLKGKAYVQKISKDPSLTDDNNCYSLKGAVYHLYKTKTEAETATEEAPGDPVAELTTDENGKSNTCELYAGTYYAKEIRSSEGYIKDETIYPVKVRVEETTSFTSEEPAVAGLVSLVLTKNDADTADGKAQGRATLSKAVFEVCYYDEHFTDAEDAQGLTPQRKWLFTTDEEGQVLYDRDHLLEGDDFYYKGETPVIPLGTVTIRETEAPEGYKVNETVFVCPVTRDGELELAETYEAPIVREEVYRGDIRGIKVFEDTGKRGALIPWRVTSLTTGESHILVTDENGQFNTEESWVSHGDKTNANDDAVGIGGRINEDKLDPEAGIWFYGREDADDGCPVMSKGALPYDVYVMDELSCRSNRGRELLTGIEFIVRKDRTVDMGTIDNKKGQEPSLSTTALDDTTENTWALPLGQYPLQTRSAMRTSSPVRSTCLSGPSWIKKQGTPSLTATAR